MCKAICMSLCSQQLMCSCHTDTLGQVGTLGVMPTGCPTIHNSPPSGDRRWTVTILSDRIAKRTRRHTATPPASTHIRKDLGTDLLESLGAFCQARSLTGVTDIRDIYALATSPRTRAQPNTKSAGLVAAGTIGDGSVVAQELASDFLVATRAVGDSGRTDIIEAS